MSQLDDKHQVKFNVMSVRAGDIIFVLPDASGLVKFKQLVNLHGQGLLAKIRSLERIGLKASAQKYSHVMLGAGDGLIIHANGTIVALEIVIDALDFKATQYQIYRHASVSNDTAMKIAKAGMRYLQQKYSFRAYFGKLRESDTTQFCSRLVAHAYRCAGMPLCELPDNNVLPLDLHMLCQSPPWKDVTADSIIQVLSPEYDKILGVIDIPGEENLSISTLFNVTDQTSLGGLRLQIKYHELVQKNYRENLHTQASLAQFCAAQLTLTKQFRITPHLIDDEYSEKIIRILSQIESLIDLAWLPNINLLIEQTIMNTDTDGTGWSAYAGLPTPAVILEMQIARETIRVLTYLIIAETGLSSILAHKFPHDKFEAFRAVKSKYVNNFLSALPNLTIRSKYEEPENAFAWVFNSETRLLYQKLYKNIITSIKLITILSSSGKSVDGV